jgi:hypothetical protein
MRDHHFSVELNSGSDFHKALRLKKTANQNLSSFLLSDTISSECLVYNNRPPKQNTTSGDGIFILKIKPDCWAYSLDCKQKSPLSSKIEQIIQYE